MHTSPVVPVHRQLATQMATCLAFQKTGLLVGMFAQTARLPGAAHSTPVGLGHPAAAAACHESTLLPAVPAALRQGDLRARADSLLEPVAGLRQPRAVCRSHGLPGLMQGDGGSVQGAEGRAQAAGQGHLKGSWKVRAAASRMAGEGAGKAVGG